MVVMWLLPFLVGFADAVAKVARTLSLLHWAAQAALGTAVAVAGAATALAYHTNPRFRERMQQLHPLSLLSTNPSLVVFGVLVCVPGVLHITNAHRFGVAAIEFLEMLPPFVSSFFADGGAVVVDEADRTLTLVLTFSPPTLLRLLHRNAGVVQSLHVLGICSCSFLKILAKASYVAHLRIRSFVRACARGWCPAPRAGVGIG